MSSANAAKSANRPIPQDLAILEDEALGPWMPELALEVNEHSAFYHPPLTDPEIVAELSQVTRSADACKDTAVADATRLAVARWAKVHCADQARYNQTLERLQDPKLAEYCTQPENELWDKSQDLQTLHEHAQDPALSESTRCWAFIEGGLLAQECGHPSELALESYLQALELRPDHLVALELAWRCAHASHNKDLARELLGRRLALAKSLKLPEDPGLRRCMGALWNRADQVRDHLDQILELAPHDTQVAHRRIAWAFMEGQFDRLPELLAALARQEHDDLELKISALHLCMLTNDQDKALGADLVEQVLTTFDQSLGAQNQPSTGALAMMRELAEGLSTRSVPVDFSKQKLLRKLLDQLATQLDDQRDQALVHEQLARMHLRALRQEPKAVLTPQDINPVLHSLQVCADMLPDLRWNREATAEVLGRVQNYPALAQHFESWASDTTDSRARAQLLLRAGRVYEHDLGEYSLALECYRQAHAEQARNPDCLRALGGCYARCGQWNDAAAVLQQQIEQATDDSEKEECLRRLVNMARYEIQDVDLALDSLQQLSALRPDDIGALYLTAAIARREDRMGVLVDALEQSIALTRDPQSQSALASELATVLDHRLDRHDQAMHWHAHALAATPGYEPSRRALCRLRIQRGDYQQALSLFLDKDPSQMDPSSLFQALIAAQHLEPDDPLRLELSAASAELLSPSPALHERSARAILQAGEGSRAYALLERLPESRFAPLAAEQHYDLGRAAQALQESEPDRAEHWNSRKLHHWNQCLELEPEHYAALDSLYQIYTDNQDPSALEALYAKVEEHLDPISRIQTLAHRARMALSQDSDLDKARSLYEQALVLSPGDSVLRFELEQLLRARNSARALFNNLVRQAGVIVDPKLKAALAISAAETLLDASSGAELKTVGRLVLSALKSDPGNPHAVGLLEQVLNLDPSVLPIRAAVSARAVRAQSDEERAVFFAESAELLEHGEFYRDAKIAYQAARDLVHGTGILEESIDRVTKYALDAEAKSNATPQGPRSTGNQTNNEQQRAVQRAIEEDNEELAARIVAQVTTQLAHDPNQPDAIYLLVQLASAQLQRAAILRSLAQLFVRLTKRGCRYRAGVLLGIHSEDPAQGASYLNAALMAKPDGLSAREALLGRFREMGQTQKQAETIRALLAHPRFTEARKPALQRELVYLLADDEQSTEEALRHCAELLREHTRDSELIQLYSSLLERQGRYIDAARALEPLLYEHRNPARIHAVRLRQAQIYARRTDTLPTALQSVQAAISAQPQDAETLELLLSLCDRSNNYSYLDAHVESIRVATVQRIKDGEADPKDLDNLSRMLNKREHPAARRVQALSEALDAKVAPKTNTTAIDYASNPLFSQPGARSRTRSSAEPEDLMELLALLEVHLPKLCTKIEDFRASNIVPLPQAAPASALDPLVHSLAQAIQSKTPVLTACAAPAIVTLFTRQEPELRISRSLWATGDLEVCSGALYLAIARYLNQGSMIRALHRRDLDLLLATAFDLAGVFHPITAEPETARLEEFKQELGQILSHAQLRAIQKRCIAMQELDLAPGYAKEACLKSDLRLAVLLSKDPRSILLTAAALDGQYQGAPIDRICQSPSASTLLGDFLSDEAMNRSPDTIS